MNGFSLWTDLWIGVAIASAIAEVALPNFAFLFASTAALVSALVAAFQWPWEIQALAFAISLLFGLYLLRPRVIHKLQSKKHVPSRTDVLIGKRAVVSEAIEPESGRGRVEVEGLDWAAQAREPIAAGVHVVIERADGIVLQVKEG